MSTFSVGSGPRSLSELRSKQSDYSISKGHVQTPSTSPPSVLSTPPTVDTARAHTHRQQLSTQLHSLTDTSSKIKNIDRRFEALGAQKIENNSKGFFTRLGRSLLKVGRSLLGGIATGGMALAKLTVKGANLVTFFKFSNSMQSAVDSIKSGQQTVSKWVDGATKGPTLQDIGEDFTGSDQVETGVEVDDVAFEPVALVGEYMGTNVNTTGLTNTQVENLQDNRGVTGNNDMVGASLGIAAGVLMELTSMTSMDQAVESFEDSHEFGRVLSQAKDAIKVAQGELLVLRNPAKSPQALEILLLEDPTATGHLDRLLELRDSSVRQMTSDISALQDFLDGKVGLASSSRTVTLVETEKQRLEAALTQGPLSTADATLLAQLKAGSGTDEYRTGVETLKGRMTTEKNQLASSDKADDAAIVKMKDKHLGELRTKLQGLEEVQTQRLEALKNGTDPDYAGKSHTEIRKIRIEKLTKTIQDMDAAVKRARSARNREALQGVMHLASSLNDTAQAVNGFINAYAAIVGESASTLAMGTQQVGGIFAAVTSTAAMIQDVHGGIRNVMRVKRSDAYLKAENKNEFIADRMMAQAQKLREKAATLPEGDKTRKALITQAEHMENQALAIRSTPDSARSEKSKNVEKAVTLMRKNQKQSAWVKAFSAVKNALGAAGAIALTVVAFGAAAALTVSPVGWALVGVAAVAGLALATYSAYKSIKRSDDISTVRQQMQAVNQQIQSLQTEKSDKLASITPPGNTIDPSSDEATQIRADIAEIDERLTEFQALKVDIKGVLMEIDPQAVATELIKVLNDKDPGTGLPTPESMEVAVVLRDVFKVQPEALDVSQLDSDQGKKMFEDTTQMLGKKLSMFYTK